MPNIAGVLKEEIRRLARKEIKAQVSRTQKTVVQHRREIAQLKRALRMQERRVSMLQTVDRTKPGAIPVPIVSRAAIEGVRFSIRSVKAQRRRLRLSAADFGKLIGVTGQTVYNWEQGRARPRRSQLAALAALRRMGRRQAVGRLAVG